MLQKFKNNRLLILCLCVTLLTWAGCKVNYSFTGASIAPEVETVSIAYFPNRAPLAQPTLAQQFTEDLKDVFISQTNLTLVDRNGDLQFEGYISNYQTKPVATQSNDRAAMNRLTVTVHVKFVNNHNPERNFESNFSRFADYESSQQLANVEDELIEDINNQLVQDIFNKAVSNW